MKLIFSFVITIFVVACSPGPGTTPAKISIGAQSTAELFPGGLYIILHKKAPTRAEELGEFRRVVDTNLEIELENGEWEFGAIGWDGSTNMSGKPKCFMSNPIILDGQDITVNIDVSFEGCRRNPFFADGMHGVDGAPLQTQFVSCAGLNTLGKTKSDTAPDDLCTGTPGPYTSFRVVSFDFPLGTLGDLNSRKVNPFRSECINVYPASNFTISTNQYIPFFEGIPQTIIAYEGSSCSGNSKEYTFAQGLRYADVNNGSAGFVLNDIGTNNNKIYLDSELCTPAKIAETTPSLGSGTEADPYIICGVNQLQALDDSAPFASANYILARNIEDASTHNGFSLVVANPFTGKFDGRNHYIKGLTTPLFNWVTGSADIRNIILKEVNIDTSTESMAGALAAKVYDSNKYLNIENIVLDDLIRVNISTAATAYVGGLIGLVDNNASNYLSISGIKSTRTKHATSSVLLNNSQVIGYAGGLVGHAKGNALDITFLRDIQLENFHIKTTSLEDSVSTGGLIGESYKIDVKLSTLTDSTVEGFSVVGGIVGRAKLTRLTGIAFTSSDFGGDPKSVLKCNTPTSANISIANYSSYAGSLGSDCQYFGGIMGFAEDGNIIHQSIAAVKVSEANAPVNNLGGIVGRIATVNSNPNKLLNNGVYITSNANGWYQGGLVGTAGGTVDSTIENNVVMGSIIAADSSKNSAGYIGGLVGLNSNGLFKRNIIKMHIDGGFSIGLAAGSNGNIIEEFVALDSVLISDSSGNNGSYTLGGITGFNGATGTISHAYLENSNISTNYNCTQKSNYGCGLITGQNANGNQKSMQFISFENVSFKNSANASVTDYIGEISNNSTITSDLVSGLAGVTEHAIIINENSNPSALGMPWVDNSTYGYIPTFLSSHLNLNGIKPEDNSFRFGNIFSPLLITTAEQWNKIQDDAYLLGKTMALENNIDFAGKDFFPIGSRDNGGTIICPNVEFTGSLLASTFDVNKSFALQNIEIDTSNYDSSTTTDGCGNQSLGIIRTLGDGNGDFTSFIGISTNPILVTDFKLTNSNVAFDSVGTIAGRSNNSFISAHIINADITDSNASNYVGGLIGYSANSHVLINNKFTGKIKSNSTYLAGLVAKTNVANNGLSSIQYNHIAPTELRSTTSAYLGGMLGYYDNASGIFGMKNNVVNLSNSTFRTSSGNAGGFISDLIPSNITVEHNLVYIGSTQLNDGHTINKTFAVSGSGGGDKNFIIGATSDSSPGVNLGNFFLTEEDFLENYSLDMFSNTNY